jgi:hypothetical protein
MPSEGNYTERMQVLRRRAKDGDLCNVILQVDMNVCGERTAPCYYPENGPNYQRLHHILACNLYHADSVGFLPLFYGRGKITEGKELEQETTEQGQVNKQLPLEYNVAIHLRVGDIVLHGEDHIFFTNLRNNIDRVLRHFLHVHYYFFAEDPKQANGNPPSYFTFLDSIFTENEHTTVSYINDMDIRSTLFHFMNADMLVITGSSFPYVAITLSTKPVVLFGKPKEHNGWDKGLIASRDDLVMIDDNGQFVAPTTLSEVQALVEVIRGDARPTGTLLTALSEEYDGKGISLCKPFH